MRYRGQHHWPIVHNRMHGNHDGVRVARYQFDASVGAYSYRSRDRKNDIEIQGKRCSPSNLSAMDNDDGKLSSHLLSGNKRLTFD
jgi:hypothetical protein